jgi:hypothetical protein
MVVFVVCIYVDHGKRGVFPVYKQEEHDKGVVCILHR